MSAFTQRQEIRRWRSPDFPLLLHVDEIPLGIAGLIQIIRESRVGWGRGVHTEARRLSWYIPDSRLFSHV